MRPVVCLQGGAHASQTRFSREHKNVILEEEENHDRTGRQVVCFQEGAHQFVIEDDEAESDLSLGSRSFLHKVNDQVRKRQKQSSMDATEDNEEHSVIWGMFMSSTLQASVFMVKNYSDKQHSIKNSNDLTMKQMFDMSEKLVSEQSDEIYGVKAINWETSSWKYLSLIGDEQVISLQRTKVYVFSDSVLCLGKMNENPRANTAWEERLVCFKSSSEYRTLDRIDGEPIEFEWNIFSRIHHVAAQPQSSRVTVEIGVKHQRISQDGLSSCRCSTTSHGDRKATRMNASHMLKSSLLAKRFGARQGSFFGPGSEKKWYSISEDSPQGEWDKMAEKMMITLAASGHTVFRATNPLSRGVLKSKGGGKLSIHYCADLETIRTVFRTITSANQLSLYGAVAEMCEEYESYHAGRPVVGEQSSSSFVSSVINTNVPLNNDDPAHKELPLRRHGERIEKLSQQDKLSKFCTDAGFLTTVEVGLYFMMKNSLNPQIQWHVVSTLCQETKIHLN